MLAICIFIAYQLGAFRKPDMSRNGEWVKAENGTLPDGFSPAGNSKLGPSVITTLTRDELLKASEKSGERLAFIEPGSSIICYAAEVGPGKWKIFREFLIKPKTNLLTLRTEAPVFRDGCVQYRLYVFTGWWKMLFSFLPALLCFVIVVVACLASSKGINEAVESFFPARRTAS